MVFQHLALFPMMTVGENVGYGLARRGVARAEIASRVGAMLERVGLPGAADRRIDQLSGGQKQRVAIARSLVLEPTLLLLDEPLGALDLKLREHMKIELKQLQADFGTTFVYITHDQSEALVLSDHVAVMNAGRFEQVGTPQELYYQPRTPFVAGFVGANNRVAGTRGAPRRRGRRSRHGRGSRRARADERARSPRATPVEAFVRPEVVDLARDAARAPAGGAALLRTGGEPALRRREFRGAGPRGGDAAPRSGSRCRRPGASPTCASARRSRSASIRSAPSASAPRAMRIAPRRDGPTVAAHARLALLLLMAPALVWLVGLVVLPHLELAVLSLRARVRHGSTS